MFVFKQVSRHGNKIKNLQTYFEKKDERECRKHLFSNYKIPTLSGISCPKCQQIDNYMLVFLHEFKLPFLS